jgi:hypothetical protein
LGRCVVVESKRPVVEPGNATKNPEKDKSPNEELAEEERPTTDRPT